MEFLEQHDALSEVDVDIELDGKPLVVTSARMSVRVSAADGMDVAEVIRRAQADSTVSNSVRAGFPVAVVTIR